MNSTISLDFNTAQLYDTLRDINSEQDLVIYINRNLDILNEKLIGMRIICAVFSLFVWFYLLAHEKKLIDINNHDRAYWIYQIVLVLPLIVMCIQIVLIFLKYQV
jgi:hypothetical protein